MKVNSQFSSEKAFPFKISWKLPNLAFYVTTVTFKKTLQGSLIVHSSTCQLVLAEEFSINNKLLNYKTYFEEKGNV